MHLKKFELLVKSFFNSLLLRGKTPLKIVSPENIFPTNLKILILRQDRIGDLIVSTSIIKELRRHLPTANIDVLLSKKNFQASACISPFVNCIFIYSKKINHTAMLIRKLRKQKYDLVIDLFDNSSTTSSFFIKTIKSKYSLGFDKENSTIYTHIVPLPDKTKFHIIDRISLILFPFGINPEELSLKPFYPIKNEIRAIAQKELLKVSNKLLVAVNVAGSDRNKYIGIENLKDLFILTQEFLPQLDLVLFSTREYEKEIKKLAEELKISTAPLFDDFDTYANYLSICDIIITPDTAAVHLASAFNKPCIALYKGTTENSLLPWYPYKTKYISLETKGDRISDIPPVEIIKALKEIIQN